jgi:preprotein translocase subunit SecG
MYVSLVVVHVIVSVSLVLIVLLQQGRGAELGAAFGGMGQATYGRGQYTFVHKATTALAVVFMATSLSLAFITVERPRTSILAPGESQPASTQEGSATPAPVPVVPAAPAAPSETPSLPQQAAPPAQGGSSQ